MDEIIWLVFLMPYPRKITINVEYDADVVRGHQERHRQLDEFEGEEYDDFVHGSTVVLVHIVRCLWVIALQLYFVFIVPSKLCHKVLVWNQLDDRVDSDALDEVKQVHMRATHQLCQRDQWY